MGKKKKKGKGGGAIKMKSPPEPKPIFTAHIRHLLAQGFGIPKARCILLYGLLEAGMQCLLSFL